MKRKREKLIIGRKIDIPLDKQGECLSYDSIRQYCNAHETRGYVRPVHRNHPLNGAAQNDNVTHQVTVFKRIVFTIDMEILWFDGRLPRRLKINATKDDEKNRRLIHLYCRELAFAEGTDSTITSYGDRLTDENTSESLEGVFY